MFKIMCDKIFLNYIKCICLRKSVIKCILCDISQKNIYKVIKNNFQYLLDISFEIKVINYLQTICYFFICASKLYCFRKLFRKLNQ